jgi:hypothetical protein
MNRLEAFTVEAVERERIEQGNRKRSPLCVRESIDRGIFRIGCRSVGVSVYDESATSDPHCSFIACRRPYVSRYIFTDGVNTTIGNPFGCSPVTKGLFRVARPFTSAAPAAHYAGLSQGLRSGREVDAALQLRPKFSPLRYFECKLVCRDNHKGQKAGSHDHGIPRQPVWKIRACPVSTRPAVSYASSS